MTSRRPFSRLFIISLSALLLTVADWLAGWLGPPSSLFHLPVGLGSSSSSSLPYRIPRETTLNSPIYFVNTFCHRRLVLDVCFAEVFPFFPFSFFFLAKFRLFCRLFLLLLKKEREIERKKGQKFGLFVSSPLAVHHLPAGQVNVGLALKIHPGMGPEMGFVLHFFFRERQQQNNGICCR